jgi:hypothetical protein
MSELQAALYSDHHDQQSRGNNPHVTLNWRTHQLVECVKCKRLMGYHIAASNTVCVSCEIKERRV